METLGKYQIKERIGHGGMGTVYRAHDPVIGRDVAIKIIREQIFGQPEIKTRFYREAKSAGRLSHENIMVIYDVGEEDGQPFIVMEYLPGTDLREMMDKGVSLSIGEKLNIALQICEGLGYAHKHSVVHRDIKPDNIRILPGQRVKILDFGIARLGNETITLTRASIGTPKYMSPEQIKGDVVDHRSDVFSFGVLLYELLSGTNPFSGTNISSISYKIVHHDPEPIPVGEGRMAEDLRAIVMKCLVKERDERYQDFDEVITDLKRSLLEGAMGEEPSSEEETTSSRPSWWVWAGSAAVLVMIAAGSIMVLRNQGEDPPPAVVSEAAGTEDVSTPDLGDLETSVEASLERMTEARRRANELSGDISSQSSYIQAMTVMDSGMDAAATGTEQGLRDALDHFREAATLFAESVDSYRLARAGEERNRTTDQPTGQASANQPEPDQPATDQPPPDQPVTDQSLQNAESRRLATGARARMESFEDAVASARASDEVQPLFRRADSRKASAEAAYSDGRYDVAADEFDAASGAFEDIAERLTEIREAESAAADRADSARTAMTTAKEGLSDAQMQSEPYGQAVSSEGQGRDAYTDGRYEDALQFFTEATALYDEASRIEAPTRTMTVEEAAVSAMESFARRTETHFSTENVDGLEAISSFFSGSEWSAFFGVAHDVEARVEQSDPVMSGGQATFPVAIHLRFLNNRDNRMDNTLRQRWSLEERQGTWTVVNIEAVN